MRKHMKKIVVIALLLAVPLALGYGIFRSKCIEDSKPTVLLFHHFKEYVYDDDPYSVTPESFEKIIISLLDRGYTFTNLMNYYNLRGKVPEKSIIITIDDGYESNYSVAFDILKKYQVPADIFLVTELINKGSDSDIAYMNTGQLIEMRDSGLINFYSHSNSHSDFTGLDEEEIIGEIEVSNSILDSIFGQGEPSFFSYPYGKHNVETVETLKSLGIELQLLVYDRIKELRGEWYVLNRHIIEDKTDIMSIIPTNAANCVLTNLKRLVFTVFK